MLTVFQVLTIEEWNVVAYHTMHSTNFYAILYFVVLIVVGTYTIVNLFVAIMVEGFATDPEAIARLKDAIEKARSMIKNMAPARSRSAAGSDVVKGDLVRSTAGSAVIDMTATTGRADNEPPALCCWRRLRRVHVKQSDNSMTSNASSVSRVCSVPLVLGAQSVTLISSEGRLGTVNNICLSTNALLWTYR